MATLRKQIGRAVASGNLKSDVNYETDIDRVGALAFADRLGVLLLRLKYSNDATAWKPAVHLLVKRTSTQRESYSILKLVCIQSLMEWLHSGCSACGGRGETVSNEGVYSTCSVCDGTGRGSLSDSEADKARMRALKLENIGQLRRWTGKFGPFSRAHDKIATAERNALSVASQQLQEGEIDHQKVVAIRKHLAILAKIT